MSEPPAARATIADVAARAGVSATTVSFVMHGKGRISARTRDLVHQAMRDLNYVYHRGAANLRRRHSQLVGLIVHDIANPFYAGVVSGAEKALGAQGYLPAIGNSADDLARQARLIDQMCEHGVAGLILCPALGSRAAAVDRATGIGVPVVLSVRNLLIDGIDYAGGDIASGVTLAIDYLTGLGHRRIALLGGVRDSDPWRERLGAYRAALESGGLACEPGLVVDCPPNRQAADQAARRLIACGRPPTAVLAYSDVVALGAASAFDALGLTVGRDIALVGLDDVAEAATAVPPLTTVAMGAPEIGAAAAAAVLARIDGNAAPPSATLIAPRLVVRESCCRPPERARGSD